MTTEKSAPMRAGRLKAATVTTRRRWTEETVTAELEALVRELGHMPSRAELTARGLGGLWSAMRRLGGVDAWRERMTAPERIIDRAAIERHAYFLSLERGGDPVQNWLQAERDLLVA